MSNRVGSSFFFLFCLVSTFADAGELKVVASRSLTTVLKEVSPFFERQHADWKVALRSESSLQIIRLLELGTPTDVVILGEEKNLQRLREKNLISKGSEIRLVSNELVVVAPESSKLEVKEPKDLIFPEINKAVVYPESSPLQEKVRAYLSKFGLLELLGEKKTEMKDSEAAFLSLTKGEADWAFVYASDAAAQKGVKVIWRVPSTDIPPVVYHAAVAEGSTQKETAHLFLESIQSTISKKIFENAGFTVLLPDSTITEQDTVKAKQAPEKKKKHKGEKKKTKPNQETVEN